MRKYRNDATTEPRIEFGIELAEGLRLFPETEEHAAVVDQATDALDNVAMERRKLKKPRLKARVKLKFEGYLTDTMLRQVSNEAQSADGGRRGPVFDTLYPDGLSAAVDPAGTQQLPATQAVFSRMMLSNHPNLTTFKQKWEPAFKDRIAALTAAIDAYTAINQQDANLFAIEMAARDDHGLLVDKIAGLVRAAFPNDRNKQDIIFPAPPTRK
ncbi:MAG: hypothetical protein HUU55_18845 [Myxococcales bacterium]|nr:hypothetical protein [Myxococcales bacterium]